MSNRLNDIIYHVVHNEFPELGDEQYLMVINSIRSEIFRYIFANGDLNIEPEELLTTTYLALKEVKAKFNNMRGTKLTSYIIYIVKRRLADFVRTFRRKEKLEYIAKICGYKDSSEQQLNPFELMADFHVSRNYQSFEMMKNILDSIVIYIQQLDNPIEKEALKYVCAGESKTFVCCTLNITRRQLERYINHLKNYLISLINGSSNI
ncbi:hypothetical protein [Spiroplasma culicicola]|uniref:Uncharacterized protein n=1 Tax=Spiroplasma culicicola AES-1 TaxID=1276246 RepID=W6AFB5_9MOLU|nr:hypothetical protein [Spiroplasma culicicola]AHI52374.1 hypothetical protein SCULI_v1c00330 [Spiroplasma culicicola AES-1]